MSLLVLSKKISLFVNTLTAGDKYGPCHRQNFLEPIHMKLSKKMKTFFEFFTCLKFTSNFENFEKKDQPQSLGISAIMDSKKRVYLNV